MNHECREQIERVDCPLCKASAGFPCVTRAGVVAQVPHSARAYVMRGEPLTAHQTQRGWSS